MVVIIFITTLLLICSFFSKAVKDTLDHHFETSVFKALNSRFWNANVSWYNKWDAKSIKEGKQKERFWGSTTIFVWLTDAWHLFDAIQALCWQIALSIWVTIGMDLTWYYGFIVFAAIKACTFAFHFPYTYFFIKNK